MRITALNEASVISVQGRSGRGTDGAVGYIKQRKWLENTVARPELTSMTAWFLETTPVCVGAK